MNPPLNTHTALSEFWKGVRVSNPEIVKFYNSALNFSNSLKIFILLYELQCKHQRAGISFLGLNPWPFGAVIYWSEKSLSHVWLFATPWTVAQQAPPSMEFSRQEYWSGLPFPSPGDLPDSGIKPGSPELRADPLPSEPPGNPKQILRYNRYPI